MTTDQQAAVAPAAGEDLAAITITPIPADYPSSEPVVIGNDEQIPGLFYPGQSVTLGELAHRMGLSVEDVHERVTRMGMLSPPVVPTVLAPDPASSLQTLTLPAGASDPRPPTEALSQDLADQLTRGGTTDLMPVGYLAEVAPPAPPPPDPDATPPDATALDAAAPDVAAVPPAPATPAAAPAPAPAAPDTTTTGEA